MGNDTETAGAAVSFTPTATDNVGIASIISTPASGSVFGLGTTTVSVTATIPPETRTRKRSSFFPGGDLDVSSVSAINVQLGDGNDRFNAVGNFGTRLLVDGGAGNDRIVGSAGGDVLLGGSGNDQIWAGSGKNILIGGAGQDFLFGGSGTDIMIGGTTSFDDDAAALRSILAEWNSGGTVAERVGNLRGTGSGGLNGTNYLTDGVTVQDDGEADFMYGAGGMDWLFYNPDDDTALGGGDLFGDDPL